MNWTEKHDKLDYIDLCLEDIDESVKGMQVNKKLASNAKDSQIKKGCKGMVNYHKETFFEQILYIFDYFDYTIQDLENFNKENEIL